MFKRLHLDQKHLNKYCISVCIYTDIFLCNYICVCLSSYLHYQASRCQILQYLCAVVASSERRCVVVHVRHVDDNRGDVAEGRLATTSLYGQVVLPGNFKVQRRDEGQKACRTTG